MGKWGFHTGRVRENKLHAMSNSDLWDGSDSFVSTSDVPSVKLNGAIENVLWLTPEAERNVQRDAAMHLNELREQEALERELQTIRRVNSIPEPPPKEDSMFKLTEKPTVKELMPALQKAESKESVLKKVTEGLKKRVSLEDWTDYQLITNQWGQGLQVASTAIDSRLAQQIAQHTGGLNFGSAFNGL